MVTVSAQKLAEMATIEEVAARVGASVSAVGYWFQGLKRPNPQRRKKIAEVYPDVSVGGWDEELKPIAVVGVAGTEAPPPGTGARDRLESLISRIETDLTTTGPATRHKLYLALVGALGKLDRIDREDDLTETRILRSKAWRGIEAVLFDVLKAHPEAADDLAAQLGRMRKEGGR